MAITLDKAASRKMTLEEFFNYDDGTDAIYEFEDGELLLMTAESEINRRIAMFILVCLVQLGIPSSQLSMKTEIVTTGLRVRVPDLVVFSEELVTVMEGAKRSTVMPEMPPPLLVVEVVSQCVARFPRVEATDEPVRVSPNQSSRDYRYKRSEYGARGIAEYWIVDPIQERVTVLEWIEGFYEEKVYVGDNAIVSPVFADLKLTAAQVLQG
ncbi:Uma2 family endonuclease [Nostocaceae cyanobacterium CENA357]|uniref:Uma2 family endonuclease n=1 Tax=Atlanticothrix silvestris CENA357 TaxID=1725252 RepID=A0A8J7H6S5_9CYAN|nr:Uma2 family endonuclease [Atlanticothrix silvestris]MBH8551176.1 Uma2 family endonuclease [Atlanticothrix silvestris CENA357]